MPNVPTTTPGPDDTEHTPEDVTETIPLITNVHADKQNGRANDAALRAASWPPLCSSPLS